MLNILSTSYAVSLILQTQNDKLDTKIKPINNLKTSNNKVVASINSFFEKLAALSNKINEDTAKLNTRSSQH